MGSNMDDVPKKETIFKKLWTQRKHFKIELFMLFYVMPTYLCTVAVQNLPLEKACRVNYNYTSIVCSTILDKGEFGIDCEEFKNVTRVGSGLLWNVTNLSPNFNYTVCMAQLDAQELSGKISGIRSPIGSIFALIMVLFAGSWSDRYNKRKLCILFPIVGEALTALALVITSIFFDEIPMEFGKYVETIVPAMFGELNLTLMAVYSLITSSTPEPDRLFRFGIFSMFLTMIGITGTPFSGILFQKLGYVYLFALSCIFQVIAFLVVIFFVDEAKSIPKQDVQVDKSQINAISEGNGNREVVAVLEKSDPVLKKNKSWLANIFDPTLAVGCLSMPFQKRKNYGQALLFALIFSYFLISAPAVGEGEFQYEYLLIKLNWNGNQYSVFREFSTLIQLLGTFIGTAILSKALKLSDPTLGFISAFSVAMARPFFAFARDSITYYAGGVLEMFLSLRSIAVRSIGSTIVEEDELGRMFAIFSLTEPIAEIIFTPLYSYVYTRTLYTFPGTFYLLGELIYIPNVIVFIVFFILLKKRAQRKKDMEGDASKDKKEQTRI